MAKGKGKGKDVEPTSPAPAPSPPPSPSPEAPSPAALAKAAGDTVAKKKPRGRHAAIKREEEEKDRLAEMHRGTCALLAVHSVNSMDTMLALLDQQYAVAIEYLEKESPEAGEVSLTFREDEKELVAKTAEQCLLRFSPEWLEKWGPFLFLSGTLLSVFLPKTFLLIQLSGLQRDLIEKRKREEERADVERAAAD